VWATAKKEGIKILHICHYIKHMLYCLLLFFLLCQLMLISLHIPATELNVGHVCGTCALHATVEMCDHCVFFLLLRLVWDSGYQLIPVCLSFWMWILLHLEVVGYKIHSSVVMTSMTIATTISGSCELGSR